MFKTIIDCCFEREHSSYDDAVAYINNYCCYQPDTVFSIEDEYEYEVGFGCFVEEVVLEDGTTIYEPDWLFGESGPDYQ